MDMPIPHAPQHRHGPGRLERVDHQTELGRLLPLWPHELADITPEARRRRIALLERALRAERRRGLAGHWTYDLARHAALLRCYRRERELLDATRPTPRPSRPARRQQA